ncbi:MAG: hypothetical protein R3A79_17270 [Nannocystaceae bacterium]
MRRFFSPRSLKASISLNSRLLGPSVAILLGAALTLGCGKPGANPGAETKARAGSSAEIPAATATTSEHAAPEAPPAGDAALCDGAREALTSLRGGADVGVALADEGLTALLAAIERDVGLAPGEAAAALRAASDPAAAADALLARWIREQLKRAAEGKGTAPERGAAWRHAACAWGLLVASPTLKDFVRVEELGAAVDRRFAAGLEVVADADADADAWDRALVPGRQAIEKRLFTLAHRSLVDAAAAAKAGDAAAQRRAAAAFALIRDRLQDKNTPAIATIEAMLAGPPAAIDVDALARDLAITFAKRSRKYCSEVVDKPELHGSAAGLSSVTEGATYSRLIAPDMAARLRGKDFAPERYLATWDALLEEVETGDDPGEIRRLSDELVFWNCAYQEALGIAECTYNRDEQPRP